MFTKKICVAGAVICYAVLIGLFVFYQQKPNRNCARGQACIRFCCKNEATCNETFIREHFEIGRSFDDFQVLLGEPKCFTKPGEKIVKKNFQYVRKVSAEREKYLFVNFSRTGRSMLIVCGITLKNIAWKTW